MLVCINSSLNFTHTKYGHGEGPALAHRAPRTPCIATRPCPGWGREAPGPRGPPSPQPASGVRGWAGHLHAVVVGALPVEVAAVVVDAAVVQRAEAHEAVLQGVVALLVHVVVPDHVLLAREPLQESARLAGAGPMVC